MGIKLQTKCVLSNLIIVLAAVLSGHLVVGVLSFSGTAGLLVSLLVASVLAVLTGGLAAIWYGGPYRKLASRLQDIAQGQGQMGQVDHIKGDATLIGLVQSVNRIINHLGDGMTEFAGTASELAHTAARMAELTERTETNTTRQQTETELVATAMNQMSATVQEVARNATEASNAAQHGNDAAKEGVMVAEQTRGGIEQLVQRINQAVEVVSRLQDESQHIGVVLDVIKNIAEQTNLLALNAAIEAARAGEAGRGFAVVADEVRTLASRTQESTREIEEMISRLQGGVHDVVDVMNSAAETGATGAEQVETTLTALNAILKAVETINTMNAQIATAAEEQSQVSAEIDRNVVNISGLSEQTTLDAKQSRQTSIKLADISQQLQKAIGRFAASASERLDLSAAKSAHLNWKTRLRSFLDGEATLTVEQAVSHRHCDFGKWYYSEGLQNYGHIQAIADVEAPHAELHKLIKTIIELKEAGDIQGAEREYQKVASISETIVGLLDKTELEARRA